MRQRIVASVLPRPGELLVDRTREPFRDRYEVEYLPALVDGARELMLDAERQGENVAALAFSCGTDAYLMLLCAEELHGSKRESTHVYLPCAPEDSHFLGVRLYVDPHLGRRQVRLLTQGRGIVAVMQQLRQPFYEDPRPGQRKNF